MKYVVFIFLIFYSFQTFANDNKFAGYCQRDDGSVYATFYKNNCHSNDKISFKEYARIKKILIKDADQEIRLTKLKNFLDQELITEEEYNYKKNEILGLPNNKKEIIKKVNVSNDVIAPVIDVPNTLEAGTDLLVEVKGSVFDDNEVVQITVDGDPINFANGKFKQKLFVKPGGQNIIITAMDKFGNQSSRTIKLTRSEITISRNIFVSEGGIFSSSCTENAYPLA